MSLLCLRLARQRTRLEIARQRAATARTNTNGITRELRESRKPLRHYNLLIFLRGEVAEWSKAAVLKNVAMPCRFRHDFRVL